ncbi:T4SS efffector SepA family protein [[Phormidium] sp. LEGE 05292]|uniref:T4SS efffector SepA family protein n=1 Tax=[Phormidium] sp. LEGE 05292 TaxID=767427 RepID=UPI001D13AD1E|nr:hypothetical protein [Phormidium sp. LEGE 05292]
MMPVVRIPDPLYKRLQAIAVPFEDTPITVIERLLNDYEARNQTQQISQTDNYKILNPHTPSNLQHTRVIQATIDNKEIRQPNWNKIVNAAHELAVRRGMSVDELRKQTLSHVVKGEKSDCGFRYIPEANISVQGVDANLAWRNTFHLVEKLKVSIEIYIEWRNKEEAAFPGEKGKLIWMP